MRCLFQRKHIGGWLCRRAGAPSGALRLVVVVGHIAYEAFRAVQLFQQDHARQLMREGLRTEGDEVPGLVPYRIVQSERTAHDKARTARSISGQFFQKK